VCGIHWTLNTYSTIKLRSSPTVNEFSKLRGAHLLLFATPHIFEITSFCPDEFSPASSNAVELLVNSQQEFTEFSVVF
jgi:hypothetical protein